MYSSVIFVSVTVITFSTFSFAKYVQWKKEAFFFETVNHSLLKIPSLDSEEKYILGFFKEGEILMMCSSILFKKKFLGKDKDIIGAHFSSSNCLPVFPMDEMKKIISDPKGYIILFKYPEFKKDNYEYMELSRMVDSLENEGVSFFMKFTTPGAANNWI